VLNAGSSSLKFALYPCVVARTWQAVCRGQIEGIGTTPRMSAKAADGSTLPVPRLASTLADGRAALALLAQWLNETFAGARIVGVGHRVVHGGPDHGSPVVVTPAILDELRKLEPLAPLHQPYNLGAIDAVALRLPGVPQVACFDTVSIAASRRLRNWCRCPPNCAKAACSAMASMAFRTNTLRPCCPTSRRQLLRDE